jgi:hypothetical protein
MPWNCKSRRVLLFHLRLCPLVHLRLDDPEGEGRLEGLVDVHHCRAAGTVHSHNLDLDGGLTCTVAVMAALLLGASMSLTF